MRRARLQQLPRKIAVPKFSWKLSKVSKAVSCFLLKFTKSSGYLRYFDSDIKNNRKCKTLLYYPDGSTQGLRKIIPEANYSICHNF